jgi:hypothetical protein
MVHLPLPRVKQRLMAGVLQGVGITRGGVNMKKRTASVAGVLLALALAVPAFPGTIPQSIVPESARWVAHLDMEKFVATKLYELLDKGGAFEIKSRDVNRWLNIDPAKDITGVTVFGFEPGGKGQIVVAVAGKFDKARMLTLLDLDEDHAETPYGAYTIHSTGNDGYGVFVNDGLIVLSENRTAVEKVLDTAGGKLKNFAGSALSASLKEVPANAFLSGILPDLTKLSEMNSQSKILEKASGLFFLAQEKQDALQFRLQVTADSPETAKNMADLVQGIIAMGRLGGNDEDMARISSLLDGLQVKLDGKVLRLDFERPSREIADLLSRGRGLHGLFD